MFSSTQILFWISHAAFVGELAYSKGELMTCEHSIGSRNSNEKSRTNALWIAELDVTGFSKAGEESLRCEQINKLICLLLGLPFCNCNLSYKSCLLFPYSNSLKLPDQSGLNTPLFNTFFFIPFCFYGQENGREERWRPERKFNKDFVIFFQR